MRVILCLLPFVIASMLCGCSDGSPDVPMKRSQAVEMPTRSGDPSAEFDRDQAKRQHAAAINDLLLRARELHREGDKEQARNLVDQVLFLDPGRVEARMLGEMLQDQQVLGKQRVADDLLPGWSNEDLERWSRLETYEQRVQWLLSIR